MTPAGSVASSQVLPVDTASMSTSISGLSFGTSSSPVPPPVKPIRQYKKANRLQNIQASPSTESNESGSDPYLLKCGLSEDDYTPSTPGSEFPSNYDLLNNEEPDEKPDLLPSVVENNISGQKVTAEPAAIPISQSLDSNIEKIKANSQSQMPSSLPKYVAVN